MASTNPYTDGTVKAGDLLVYLPRPELKLRFKFAGHGSAVVCSVDPECQHLVTTQDVIVHRRKLAFVPSK